MKINHFDLIETFLNLSTFYSIDSMMINAEIYMLQSIQMKLILLCVWAEPAVLGRNRLTHIHYTIQCIGQGISLKITHDLNHDFTFYCTHNQLCVPQ